MGREGAARPGPHKGAGMAGKSTRARKNLGDSGERVAALYVEERGYKVLARNFRTRAGEIDLVAQDADGLAFVEVRTRRGDASGAPEESLTPAKRRHLLAAAFEFLETRTEYADCPWRIDLVAIELGPSGRIVRIDLIKGVVES